MKRLQKSVIAMALIGTMVFSASACATGEPIGSAGSTEQGSAEESRSESNEEPFIATYSEDFLSIAPLGDVGAATKAVLRNMHDAIYRYNPDGSLSLSLAESVNYTTDGTYIIADIVLKDGIKFHNGQEITAEDVKYSYERLAGLVPEIDATLVRGGGYFANMMNGDPTAGFAKGSIEVVDEKHLIVTLDDNYGVLTTMHQLADGLVIPRDYPETSQQTDPIGAGPYKFVSYSEGDKIVFERFEEYHGEKPDVKNVEFHKYADSSVLSLAFQSGDVDILQLTDENYDTVKDMGVYIYEGLSNDVYGLFLNETGEFFDDIRVRQALHYAIDGERINQTVRNGRGAALNSHMSPFLETYYNDELDDLYTVDIEKAKALLAEAGYPDGFTVNLKIVEGNLYQDIASVVKAELEPAGIILEIESIPWNNYYEDVYRGRNFDICLLNVVGYPDPSRVLSRYTTGSSGNIGNYSSEEVDRLLNEAYASADQEVEAVEKYKEVQRILAEEAAAYWTIDPGVMTALSEGYTGYENYPFAFSDISLVKYEQN